MDIEECEAFLKYIISYDITSDRIRNKAAKIIEEFGVRIQYSVFECGLKKNELKTLKQMLENLINDKTDSIIFMPLCESCYNKILFIGTEYTIKQISFVNVD